jgi:hypothetical protein
MKRKPTCACAPCPRWVPPELYACPEHLGQLPLVVRVALRASQPGSPARSQAELDAATAWCAAPPEPPVGGAHTGKRKGPRTRVG